MLPPSFKSSFVETFLFFFFLPRHKYTIFFSFCYYLYIKNIMATKKITLNELRSIVKQIIKEEVEPAYGVSKNLNNYITIPHMLKKSEVISLFVDYTNKFNDIEKFAKHFGYPLDSAEYIIKKGEELYNQEKYNK